MIRNFWARNFLSIRDKQELSFIAKGPASELVSEIVEGVFLYKLGILFGANASGKSNMLLALNQVFHLLVTPQTETNNEVNVYMPFMLSKNESTEMYVSFYANKIRYDYYVEYNGSYILKEKLHYYPNNSKALFYERTFKGEDIQADIKFGNKLDIQQKTQERIRENTLNNHSVLSVCRKNALTIDITPLKALHGWIMDNYHEVDGDDSHKSLVDTLKSAYSNLTKYKFYNIMLQKADLNIIDYKPIIEDRIIPNELREHIMNENIPESIKETILKPTLDSISFLNKSQDGNFEIPFHLQSKGTIKYISILEALYDMITGSHVYYLDELGEDLHYDLLFYYLNVFLYNSQNSQLIITSQETSLLSQDLINDNRGVVWFVEKNKDTASSEYTRGDDFGLHKNLSLYNSYRIGRLGAKPELGSIFINLED